jgi:hypothetical protein
MYYNMKKAVFWENNDGSDYSIEYFNLILKRVAHILGGTVIIPILLTECTKKMHNIVYKGSKAEGEGYRSGMKLIAVATKLFRSEVQLLVP